MTPEDQLRVISEGAALDAVLEHLDGDWDRVSDLFNIPRSMFDDWADSVELPYMIVLDRAHTWDGIYCIEENGRWSVFLQEREIRVFEVGVYDDSVTAKREALAHYLLNGIPLK